MNGQDGPFTAGTAQGDRRHRMTDLLAYRFGVNYTPSRNWYYFWNDFDADAVARDFDAVASLGADHMRVMAIWPFFQPNPAWLSGAHLDRLDRLMELAAQRGLSVLVALLNGFVSGYFFLPSFERQANPLTSARTFAAQEVYFRGMGRRLMRHDNFLGTDLGNELNCCWRADGTAAGDEWMARSLALCREAMPGRVHVNGVDHQPWFGPKRDAAAPAGPPPGGGLPFSPRALAAGPEIIALHCWPAFTGALDLGGPFDPPSIHLGAAMTALARSYAGLPDKPVWIQEYGACEDWMPPERIGQWLDLYTRSAIAAGAGWFTWWDSHDIDRKLQFVKHEYSLGLMTNDNRVKPQGQTFRALAEEFRGRRVGNELLGDQPPAPPDEWTFAATWRWLLDWIASRRPSP